MLAVHLREAANVPFAFGSWDCGMNIARWVERRIGVDPAEGLRYRTALGLARLVRRAGGLVSLIGPRLEAAGLKRVDDAGSPGDVGVVRATTGDEFCAILAASARWVAKAERGLFSGTPPVIAVWGF